MHRNYNEDLFESTKMTFGEHLDELRSSLIKAMLALVVGVLVGLLVAGQVVDYVQTPLKNALMKYYTRVAAAEYRKILLEQRAKGLAVPEDLDAAEARFAEQGLVTEEHLVNPHDLIDTVDKLAPGALNRSKVPAAPEDKAVKTENLVPFFLYHKVEDDPRVRVIGLSMEEPFVVYMKAALVVGATIASPFIFYFIWQFVAAGLYPHEKRYVHVFLPFSIALFVAGAALAFFVVFRFVLDFLLTFNDWMGIDPDPRITDWLTFVLVLPLGFGISFQLPLVMLFLERIGIFSVKTYLSNWRISVLVISFLSMVLTPSDPYSMMLMATPLVALFFFGILLCKWMPRRTTPFGEVIE
ncbi:MAG: twin-arginine translocase subunit TatC [Pirellulales bacterium]